MISVLDHETGMATAAEMAAIDEFNYSLVAGGHWVMGVGLGAPDDAVVIDGRGGSVTQVPGLNSRSTDYISGFWIIEAADMDEAKVLAAQGSLACNRRVELRGMYSG